MKPIKYWELVKEWKVRNANRRHHRNLKNKRSAINQVLQDPNLNPKTKKLILADITAVRR
jgi:hypothetical protein